MKKILLFTSVLLMATTVFAQKEKNLAYAMSDILQNDMSATEQRSRRETQARMMAPFYSVCTAKGHENGKKAIAFFQERFGLVESQPQACANYEREEDVAFAKSRTCKVKNIAYKSVDDWFVTCHCVVYQKYPKDDGLGNSLLIEKQHFIYRDGEWKQVEKDAKKAYTPLCKPVRNMTEDEKYAYTLFQVEEPRSMDPHENEDEDDMENYSAPKLEGTSGARDPHYVDEDDNEAAPQPKAATRSSSHAYPVDPHEHEEDFLRNDYKAPSGSGFTGGDPHANGNWK